MSEITKVAGVGVGTYTGVGMESAILFAKSGYKVYATMRNLQKADELKAQIKAHDLKVELLPLDVTDVTSIKTAVKTIIDKGGRIDVLINNAGAGFAKTTEQATIEKIKWVTDVNYFGVVYTSGFTLYAETKI